jgi:hypothetical protein
MGMTNANKVTLPREVAEAIDYFKLNRWTNSGIYGISTNVSQSPLTDEDRIRAVAIVRYFGCMKHDLLMKALVNGYEVEKSPEDEIRDYMRELRMQREGLAKIGAILHVLNTLDIKIEGVNNGC